MSNTADLLIEIGTEELPPVALPRLATAMREELVKRLAEHQLTHGTVEGFATPRRLAVRIADLALAAPDQHQTRRGPALAAAFNAEGQPTQAALGFARSCGVEIDALGRLETDKGAWLVHEQSIPGRAAAELLPELTEQALAALPIPKRMRWGAGEAAFVRPVHWICALLGDQLIAGEVMGLPIGRETRGHRFHAPAPITIPHPCDYDRLLREQGWVEPDFAARRARIAEQVSALAASAGGQTRPTDALLNEVTALCEWPVALLGRFDAAFLEVPPEVLIETMQKNQKYFPVFGTDGALLPCFITICNIDSREPDLVRAGNERVITPRFADARFFWEQDLKEPLASRIPKLADVVFQDKLGSLAERAGRVARVLGAIATPMGLDPAEAERAAQLAKCDLVTLMVGEFGSLQGIIGRYYAQHGGESAAIANAMAEQYLPRQAGDQLPATPLGQALALADRLDTLVGVFAIGERPTGVKDPYGLRRAAIGVLRLLIEIPLELDLKDLLRQSAEAFPAAVGAPAVVDEVLSYCLERLSAYYQDQGIAGDRVAAVLSLGISAPADIDRRVRAVEAFSRLPESAALAAANKRIANILKKAPAAARQLDADVLREPEERKLAGAVAAVEAELQPRLASGDYAGALIALAGLREPVDAFFDAIMVMAEDPQLRDNRLALLEQLQQLFLRIADIAKLQ
ncbi:glycine--tRNA ligase subunit beta [Thiorhodovibrio frisius]|uniref:Glycine--tRNA ligase beta subunit n=1 Tax=Thiorhodovibrio frisius TaxID=631362 RepID=H8YZH1_9GAMM|nr:glycine--tRNA ligase subunit beta [Thiorhodovibrio frisius]EIC22098.1 glycyl-tRNA synthetase, tetrameric type, beta subunit [Thiorhodovibrio frisius]WPL24391.1 Glycine--tRNA ligase beta subunit [Thiorhodovibrio frisius]